MCVAKSDVRFTPNSDHKSKFPHKVMSALPQKADMCGAHVCFGPQADFLEIKAMSALPLKADMWHSEWRVP
jgi:hypothetical protein